MNMNPIMAYSMCTQSEVVNGASSQSISVLSVVPQGTVLRPFMFLYKQY